MQFSPSKASFNSKMGYRSKKLMSDARNNRSEIFISRRDKSKELPKSPSVESLKEHINKYNKVDKAKQEFEVSSKFSAETRNRIQQLMDECKSFNTDKAEGKPDEEVRDQQFKHQMFVEDLRWHNYERTSVILQELG